MDGRYEFGSQSSKPRLVNVGCGSTIHPDWINLDLIPGVPGVIQHNLCSGLPFHDNEVDVVYHSHVLEHLAPDQGERMLTECFRVLRPGGVLRIVVPDLEQIARLYLEFHALAWEGDLEARQRYEWIKLELLDQMVRSNSGGKMGRYLLQLGKTDADFVRSRLGQEVLKAVGSAQNLERPAVQQKRTLKQRFDSWRERLAIRCVSRILGRSAATALVEALFRNRGEIHRWMYDRYSIRALCTQIGFEHFQVQTAASSSIAEFETYQLDRDGESVRKPDSLFCECRKPLSNMATISTRTAA